MLRRLGIDKTFEFIFRDEYAYIHVMRWCFTSVRYGTSFSRSMQKKKTAIPNLVPGILKVFLWGRLTGRRSILEYTMYTFMVGTWEVVDVSAKYIRGRKKAVTLESSPTLLCGQRDFRMTWTKKYADRSFSISSTRGILICLGCQTKKIVDRHQTEEADLISCTSG